jgi:hypothetical protein
MPNPIKYSTGSETLSLKKGNFYIGTGDVGKGPSDTTGYYQGPSPTSGGYVIYLNKSGVPGDLSYHSAANDSQLISFTNNLSGTSFTSATQCLNYYATQTDKVCFNIDYEGIVTNGLVLNLDAGFTPSYSQSGITWYDIGSSSNNGSMVNGPSFSSTGGGSLFFDGVNDYGNLSVNPGAWGQNSVSLCVAVYPEFDGETYGRPIFSKNESCVSGEWAIEYGRSGINNGTNKFSFNSAVFVTSTNTFPKNAWYIVGFSFDASNRKYLMYVNGNLEASGTGVTNLNNHNGTFGIGRFSNCYPNVGPWKGGISYIQLYNRALSSSELLQNYNAQKGRFGL